MDKPQNITNHIRYYAPHHFVFYPVVFALIGLSLYLGLKNEMQQLVWFFMAAAFFMVAWLSFMMRQHYALTLQNRIIRLEMQFRYYSITHERLSAFDEKLTDAQLFALRFASDEQLPELLQRAIKESMSAGNIKKAITVWNGDYHRV